MVKNTEKAIYLVSSLHGLNKKNSALWGLICIIYWKLFKQISIDRAANPYDFSCIIRCYDTSLFHYVFYPHTWRSWGWGYLHRLECQAGRPTRPVRLSAFRFQSRPRKSVDGFPQFWTSTSLRRCRCAFWSFWNFSHSNGRPSAIISCDMPNFWPHFVSCEDLGNTWVYFIHIAHAHPLARSLQNCFNQILICLDFCSLFKSVWELLKWPQDMHFFLNSLH